MLKVNSDPYPGRPLQAFPSNLLQRRQDFSRILTHKHYVDDDEDWQYPGKVEDVLNELSGWDPVVHEPVKATPSANLADYKLVFRDPLPTFISKKAQIALIGDAAHPFLPTSIQGDSQAVEDGATLAVCLEKSGKGKVRLAVRVYEAIRYRRVHRAQRMGVTTREQWHKADWDEIWKDPKSLHPKSEAWLLDSDPEAYAYEVIDATFTKLDEKTSGMERKDTLPTGTGMVAVS